MAEDHTTRIGRRLVGTAAEIAAGGPESMLYQHTVLCQTALPYRDPGDETRTWERRNGEARLKLIAGEVLHPATDEFVPVGLPFGPKPRLILAHLNAEAIRSRSRMIPVGDSLTGFVERLGLATHGRNVRAIKDQLARLAAASIRMGVARDGRSITINSQIVGAFDLWCEKDGRQRALWPATVKLSEDYFDSLIRHAVPLDERALAALSHSAMALDVYAWLAQRLNRIVRGQRVFLPWTALQAQFGGGYDRVRKFREVFMQALRQVLSQYQGARIEVDERGMTLWASPPPVKGRTAIVVSRPEPGG